jgi:hypothetical protein
LQQAFAVIYLRHPEAVSGASDSRPEDVVRQDALPVIPADDPKRLVIDWTPLQLSSAAVVRRLRSSIFLLSEPRTALALI